MNTKPQGDPEKVFWAIWLTGFLSIPTAMAAASLWALLAGNP
jgi:hypothetical protein